MPCCKEFNYDIVDRISHRHLLISSKARFTIWRGACQFDTNSFPTVSDSRGNTACFLFIFFTLAEIRVNVIHSSCNQFYETINGWSQIDVQFSEKLKMRRCHVSWDIFPEEYKFFKFGLFNLRKVIILCFKSVFISFSTYVYFLNFILKFFVIWRILHLDIMLYWCWFIDCYIDNVNVLSKFAIGP